jgi:hypothetical protein
LANIRKFTVAPEIIYSLIKAQAGTLAKSVGECVMNSIDAAASLIDIAITQESILIRDDGRGFQTREEIEQCFEVFGFEHEGEARTFGQFGIGRAQLWNYCPTVWTTHEFRMVVDIRNRGLDYELMDGLPHLQGLTIEGRFYEPLSVHDLYLFEKELKELVKFVAIPVRLNGKRVNKDIAREKWTYSTPEAWIKLKETGELAVYNLGFLIRSYPASEFGCGGFVVSKPGVRFALNMARNDILTADCEVWKKIKPLLQQKEKPLRIKMTEAKREQLAQLFLAGQLAETDVRESKIIQDILGRYHTLTEIAPELLWGQKPVTAAPLGNTLAEYVHRSKRAFVLQQTTLDRFRADHVQDFMEQMKAGMIRLHPWYQDSCPVVLEDFREVCREFSGRRLPVPPKEWSKEEQAAIGVLNQLSVKVGQCVGTSSGTTVMKRQIDLGISDTDKAWTDGRSHITFDRNTLALARRGLGGWQILFNILLQQYLQDSQEDGRIEADQAFYQRYHDATIYILAEDLTLLETAFKRYVNQCRKLDIPLSQRAIQAFDLLGGRLDTAL